MEDFRNNEPLSTASPGAWTPPRSHREHRKKKEKTLHEGEGDVRMACEVVLINL